MYEERGASDKTKGHSLALSLSFSLSPPPSVKKDGKKQRQWKHLKRNKISRKRSETLLSVACKYGTSTGETLSILPKKLPISHKPHSLATRMLVVGFSLAFHL